MSQAPEQDLPRLDWYAIKAWLRSLKGCQDCASNYAYSGDAIFHRPRRCTYCQGWMYKPHLAQTCHRPACLKRWHEETAKEAYSLAEARAYRDQAEARAYRDWAEAEKTMLGSSDPRWLPQDRLGTRGIVSGLDGSPIPSAPNSSIGPDFKVRQGEQYHQISEDEAKNYLGIKREPEGPA